MTAVEQLMQDLDSFLFDLTFKKTTKEIWDKALEMEKKQIIDAVNFGDERGKITTYSTAEQYYIETFKKE